MRRQSPIEPARANTITAKLMRVRKANPPTPAKLQCRCANKIRREQGNDASNDPQQRMDLGCGVDVPPNVVNVLLTGFCGSPRTSALRAVALQHCRRTLRLSRFGVRSALGAHCEDLGFEAGMFAGSIASFAVLGAPDIAMLTLADADHGYGNPLKVKRTVEELETAREPYGSCFARTNEARDTARRLREMVEGFSRRRLGWRDALRRA